MTTAITKIPNILGPNGHDYNYNVVVPFSTTDKLYTMVDYIVNSYPKKYVEMLNKDQKEKKFTVEQLVDFWTGDFRSVLPSQIHNSREFIVNFDKEEDAVFFTLAFGDN